MKFRFGLIRNMIVCCTVLLLLSGCSRDASDGAFPAGKYPLELRAAGLKVVTEETSRSIADNNWEGVSQMAVMVGGVVKKYSVVPSADNLTATIRSDDPFYWTSREALESKELPASLVIIGGGVIGMEFASFFTSLGVQVQVVEMMDKILGPMDRELSAQLQAEYAKKGVKFHLSTKVTAVNGTEVTIENANGTATLHGDKVLLSVGRRPVTKGFGLESLALEPYRNGVKVNEYMQTSLPNVYACGDITAFSLLAHTAVSEAEVAIDHILGRNRKMSYKAIPGVVYTNPEFAGVGKTEEELQASGIAYEVKKVPMAFSGRFVAENEMGNGVCKWLVAEDGTLLGAHLLGNPSSELIVTAGIAIEQGMKAEQLKEYVFPHPTVGEILKEF